ncbi:hypothetical protein M3I54_36950 [Paraburkholderia sp. CNPSo 3274]|uniref:recombination directionality factor n=1 Tax=unclassified Paraburkholderia TaxID=2615204 RepID=UPI0020B8D965|nr:MULTISPECIES: hypothetical protein [unclassified Paraburkholderia]MCP3712453.1 hypothetical protein [Paraburkholderia sp. CNPSo 3274]MCP3718450.1 hypothetical protein [Paraburkholderia sp. CNPSo 3281]MCP3724615.1 hypothetical protein [Paraburkholderia sp. CNPSo 3272]MCX5545423.1 hypothetical protein [Paraburkholderia sp. CNPSo 3076]
MNAVVPLGAAPVRSIVEERAPRAPVIGRIRPGIKVLTSAARQNEQAVKLYEQLVAAGESFEKIGDEIERRCKLRNALAPRNVPYFTCRRSDFTNPDVADEILRLYGEDRGDGRKLYRFPVVFAFNDWMANIPNEMATWGTTGRKFFSEYGADGTRFCKQYEKPERDVRAQRAQRNFGPRSIMLRQDNAIPDGVCNPQGCPQYQARQCNLSARFIFAVPEIKGLGLIELPTNSIYVLQKAYSAMQTVALARGKLTGTRFWISKREFEITRINEQSEPVRQMQMLTVLDADIDISALLDGAEDHPPAIAVASEAAALLEGATNVYPLTPAGGPAGAASDAHEVVEGLGLQPSGSPTAETLEEKRDRMSDLLSRLGLSVEDRQRDFRVFAHATYGRGWVQRLADVDGMNARLEGALENREKLDREIESAVRAAMRD